MPSWKVSCVGRSTRFSYQPAVGDRGRSAEYCRFLADDAKRRQVFIRKAA